MTTHEHEPPVQAESHHHDFRARRMVERGVGFASVTKADLQDDLELEQPLLGYQEVVADVETSYIASRLTAGVQHEPQRLIDYFNADLDGVLRLTTDQERGLAAVIRTWQDAVSKKRETGDNEFTVLELAHYGLFQRAKRMMVVNNLPLVVQIAKGLGFEGVDNLDVINAGARGLEHAARKFDERKGYTFGVYARRWIRSHIQDEFRIKKSHVRIRHTDWPEVRAIQRGSAFASNDPHLRRAAQMSRPVHVDSLAPDHQLHSLADIAAKDPADVIFAIDNQETITTLRQHLKPQFWHILEAKYLSDEQRTLTDAELAESLGVTRQAVAQRLARARAHAHRILSAQNQTTA